jgi:hypothetical protein
MNLWLLRTTAGKKRTGYRYTRHKNNLFDFLSCIEELHRFEAASYLSKIRKKNSLLTGYPSNLKAGNIREGRIPVSDRIFGSAFKCQVKY